MKQGILYERLKLSLPKLKDSPSSSCGVIVCVVTYIHTPLNFYILVRITNAILYILSRMGLRGVTLGFRITVVRPNLHIDTEFTWFDCAIQ